jgi:hypothetical protein
MLDYDGVYLAEGEWPAKAYFDALRQARKRDASMYLDYGYTRPKVMSRGPVPQGATDGCDDCQTGGEFLGPEFGSPAPEEAAPDVNFEPSEMLPTPGSNRSTTGPSASLPSNQWPVAQRQRPYPADSTAANEQPVWKWAER